MNLVQQALPDIILIFIVGTLLASVFYLIYTSTKY